MPPSSGCWRRRSWRRPRSRRSPGKLQARQRRRAAVHHLIAMMGVSERFACRVTGQHRTTQRRRRQRDAGRPGCRDAGMAAPLGQSRIRVGGFAAPITTPAPRAGCQPQEDSNGCGAKEGCGSLNAGDANAWAPAPHRPMATADAPNRVWAVDFQFDATTDGRPIKIVSIVDEHTRECLGGLVERYITAEDLIDELDRVAAAVATRPCCAATTAPSWRAPRWPTGPANESAWRSSRQVSRGATAISNLSTAGSATNASTSTSSGHWRTPASSSAIGSINTTTTDPTPPSTTSRQPATPPHCTHQ